MGAANAYAFWAWNPPAAAAAPAAALATGEALAASSLVAGLAGTAAQGAVLERDMPIFAHAKEMILPPRLSQHVMETAGTTHAAAERRTSVNTFHFNIHGATDAQEVGDQVMLRVQRFFKNGGVMKN